MSTKTAPRAHQPARHSLSYQLCEIIEARGMSAYAAARLAGVDPGVVSRFMTGERDIRLATADRLASALGLRLVELGKKIRGKTARPDPGSGDPVDVPSPALDVD